MRLARQSTLPRDGSLDNTLVAHEWGHYLSNRLIGNANGLGANQARGLGEGWSDFVSLLLLVKEGDRALPANADFGGVYSETPYPSAVPTTRRTCSTTRTTTASAATRTRAT